MSFASDEVELLQQIARDTALGSTFGDRLFAISDALTKLIPVTSLSVIVIDPARANQPPAHTFVKNVTVADGLEYATRYLAYDPMRVVYQTANGNPALLSDFITRRQFGHDPFTSDFLGPLRIRSIMGVVHRMPLGALLGTALHRDRALPDFSWREREALRLAAPDIARAAGASLVNERLDPGAPALGPSKGKASSSGLTRRRPQPGSPELLTALCDRAGLTPRERQVATLAASGTGNRAIAHELGNKPATVAVQLGRVFAKLGVADRHELTTLLLTGRRQRAAD